VKAPFHNKPPEEEKRKSVKKNKKTARSGARVPSHTWCSTVHPCESTQVNRAPFWSRTDVHSACEPTDPQW